MKTRTLLLAALTITVALAPAAQATTVDAVNWGAPGAPVDAAPGDTGVALSISIRNTDNARYMNVHASLGATDGVTPVPGGDQATLAGAFAVGDVWVPKFFVNIAPTATVGTTYAIPVTLSLRSASTGADSTQVVYASIQLTGRPQFAVSSDTTSVPQGSDANVTLTFANVGDAAAGGVTASFAPAQGSALTPSQSAATLGGILAGASKTTTLKLRASGGSTAALSVGLSYKTASGAAMQETRTLFFDVANATTAARANVAVTLAEDHLDSGRAGALTFTVANHAAYALRDAVVSLSGATGTTTTYTVRDASDVQSLGDVAPDASATARVNLITSNSATGLQKLTLTVSWQAPDGSIATQAYNFGIAILGTVEFQVSGTGGSFDPTSGAGTVTGTLTNLGNAIAHNAYVSLGPSAAYAPTQETYLGDINPNSALPFTLQTTLTNTSLLTSGGRDRALNGSGFQRGANGGFPNGSQPNGGAPPTGGPNGTDGGFRNGGRGGFRGFGGANNATFTVRWNDEYGATHSATYSVATTPRAAGATTTSARAAAADTSGLGGIPTLWLGLGAGAIALGCVAAVVAIRRRRDQGDFEE